ncbi:MAG: ROK family protein [Planctomycetota bacterium]
MSDSKVTVSADDAKRPIYAGIDVGGTNIKFGLVDDNGQTVAYDTIRTESERGPEDAVARMAAQVNKMIAGAGLDSNDVPIIGLATPGTMDIAAGLILEPSNLPTWRHFAIREELKKASGKPVLYANDAGAAGYGEYWCGCGRQYPSLVLLTLGTGVGAGIILNGVSIDGEHSHGAECGHNIIDMHENARICSCGQRGHLEAYCSATGIVKRIEEKLKTARSTSLRQRIDDGESLTTLMLAQEAEKGDGFSLEMIDETAVYLGVGITTIVHTIDPSIVVLGGAVNFGGKETELGQRFLSKVTDEFRRRAMPVLAENTVLDFAILGGDAGYVGAAGLAREEYLRQS